MSIGKSFMRPLQFFTLATLLFISCHLSARAQAAKSELVGEIRDPNHSLIAQGKISLTEVATGQVSATAATDGTYTISNLRPGLYNIAASADGFKQSVREGV